MWELLRPQIGERSIISQRYSPATKHWTNNYREKEKGDKTNKSFTAFSRIRKDIGLGLHLTDAPTYLNSLQSPFLDAKNFCIKLCRLFSATCLTDWQLITACTLQLFHVILRKIFVGSCSRQNAYTVLHSAVFYSECNIDESINLFADDSKGQLTESVKNSTFSKNVEQDSKAQWCSNNWPNKNHDSNNFTGNSDNLWQLPTANSRELMWAF